MKLREYQHDMVARIEGAMRSGARRVLLQSPTGSGKTALTAHLLARAAAKGKRAWFIVHRRELVRQSSQTFTAMGLRHDVLQAGRLGLPGGQVLIASVQLLSRRLKYMKPPDLLVFDESHHVTASSWDKVSKHCPSAYHVGLTATPCRLDGRGLSDHFDVLLPGPSVAWLISEGWLSPYRMFAPPSGIDMAAARTVAGDWNKKDVGDAVTAAGIVGRAVDHYRKHLSGKRAIVFAPSIEHSESVVREFDQAGIKAAHIDGEDDTHYRDSTLSMFARDQIRVVSNVDLFGEGFDVPGIDGACLMRPTKSLGLFLQQVGRALRPVYAASAPVETAAERRQAMADGPKPFAVLLDQVGNVDQHGLPDTDRTWSLDGAPIAESGGVRICESCFAANPSGTAVCGFCGATWKKRERAERAGIEQLEGELEELTAERIAERFAKKAEQRQAQSFEDLVALGRSRGYRHADRWAKHVFNARQARRVGR